MSFAPTPTHRSTQRQGTTGRGSPLKSVRFNPPAIRLKMVESEGQLKLQLAKPQQKLLPSVRGASGSLSNSKCLTSLTGSVTLPQMRDTNGGFSQRSNSKMSARHEKLLTKKQKLGQMQKKIQKDLEKKELLAQLGQLQTNRKLHKLSEGMYMDQLRKLEDFKSKQEQQTLVLQQETERNLSRMRGLTQQQAHKLEEAIRQEQLFEAETMGSPDPARLREMQAERKRIEKKQRQRQRQILAEAQKKAVNDKRPEHKPRALGLDFFDAQKEEMKHVLERRKKNVAQLQKKLHQRIRQHGTLENAFKAFDLNGDGRWSQAEFKSCLKMLGCMLTKEDQDAILKHVSEDGDKYITINELESFLDIPGAPKEKTRKESKAQRREDKKRREDDKKRQQRNKELQEPQASFLELEKHGRKPFRWFDDE